MSNTLSNPIIFTLIRWITNDANLCGFSQLLLIPCLFFTLMLGPSGLLAYFALKTLFGYKNKEKIN